MKVLLNTICLMLLAAPALAQNVNPPAPANFNGEPISVLMFFTLGAALFIAIGALMWFLRKKSNRDATDRALNPNNPANR